MKDTPIKKIICGYGFVIQMNGVAVLCIVQSRDKTEAVEMILASGREMLDTSQVHPVTLIPGHRDDVFPDAIELDLSTIRLIHDRN